MDPDWQARVRAALLADNAEALRRLFALALAAEGRRQASASWLAAVSGFDADAVTG